MHSSALIAAAAIFAYPLQVMASPYQPLVQFSARNSKQNNSLELRDCVNPCGWSGQYCCGSDQTCTTLAGDIASCVAGGSGGGATAFPGASYQVYTTTFVEVDSTTVTSTGSYMLSPAVGTPYASPGTGGIQCAAGEQSCGYICCASNQICGSPGQCIAATAASQSAFIRPTSNGVATITAAATTTMPFTAPINSGGATVDAQPVSSGLSAGAIAGIVIGVLVGLFILFLILACLCCKGIIDTMLALVGLGKKRRVEETTIIESRHSHHGSRPPPRRNWFGMVKPARSDVVVEEKKKSGFGWLGVGGILAGLALVLGLKRRHDRKEEEKQQHSYYSGSYYSDEYSEYTTSQSSASTRGPPRSHRSAGRSVARSSRR